MADNGFFGFQTPDLSFANPFGGTASAPNAPQAALAAGMPDQNTAPTADAPQQPPPRTVVQPATPGQVQQQEQHVSSAAEQYTAALDARIQRGQAIMNGPAGVFVKLFGGQQAYQEKLDQLQQLQQQRQQIEGTLQQTRANRALADNMGVQPGALGPNPSQDEIVQDAVKRFRSGDMSAYKGLVGAGRNDVIQAYMPDAMSSLSNKVSTAADVVGQLDAAPSQAAFNAVREKVTREATELHGLGLDQLPKTLSEWRNARGGIMTNLLNAQKMVSGWNRQMAVMTDFQPVTDEKVGKAVGDSFKLSNGEVIPGTTVVQRSMDGAMGAKLPVGSRDMTKYGTNGPDGWSAASPEQIKTVTEQSKADTVKGPLSVATTVNKFKRLTDNEATWSNPTALAQIQDQLGAMGRNVEGSHAAGSIGLTKMNERTQGRFEHLINVGVNEIGALRNWYENGKKGPEPRVSDLTKREIREYADFAQKDAMKEVGERAGQPFYTAGLYGISMDKLGLDRDMQAVVQQYHDQGRAKYMQDVSKYAFIVNPDGSRTLFPQGSGAKAAGAVTAPLPPSAYPASVVSPPDGGQPPAAPGAATSPPLATGGGTNPPQGGTAAPNLSQAVDNRARIAIESGGKPGQQTGSYRGLAQLSPQEMQRWGVTDPDNPEQVNAALTRKSQWEGGVLTKAGIDNTPANRYLVHQQGEAGAVAHLQNPGGVAWQNVRRYYPSDAVAKQAIWNNLPASAKREFGSVDNVTSGDFTRWWTDRYNRELVRQGGNPEPAIGREGVGRAARAHGQRGQPPDDPYTPGIQKMTPDDMRRVGETGTGVLAAAAPVVGSVGGAIAGGTLGAVGGPAGVVAGGMAGGAAGGALGQGIANKMTGRPTTENMIESGALGATAGIPGLGPAATAARVGVAGVGGTLQGLADGQDVARAAVHGASTATGAVAGETVGRFISALGMSGHKLISQFSPSAQDKLLQAAKIVSEQEPKVTDATGKQVVNPIYEQAEKTITGAGQKVEEVKYAYEQVKNGANKGDALIDRPAAVEKQRVAQGYDELRDEVGATGVGAVKQQPNVPNGPMSTVRTKQNPSGTVPEKFAADAQDAELRVSAPAANWQQKWQQLQEARSDLLTKEREALTPVNKDTERADAMRKLADSVRIQQVKAAEYVFGPQKGKEVIQRLETLDRRYAIAMKASGGRELAEVIAEGGEKGRAAKAAFDALAHDDPVARRMMTALSQSLKNKAASEASLMVPLIAAETVFHGAPVLSGVIGAYKLTNLLKNWMTQRAAGGTAKFSDILRQATSPGTAAAQAVPGMVGAQQGSNAMPVPAQ